MSRCGRPWALCTPLLLAAVLVSSCRPPGELASPGVPPELKHSWEASFNRGDVEGVVRLYAPDAELVMPGTAPVHGHASIRAAVSDMIKSGVRVQTDTARNIGSPDVAYVYGGYRVTDSGAKVVEQGRYVETWERRPEGWRIVVDINTAGPVGITGPTAAAGAGTGR